MHHLTSSSECSHGSRARALSVVPRLAALAPSENFLTLRSYHRLPASQSHGWDSARSFSHPLMLLKLRKHCTGVLGPSGMSWLSPLCPRILDPHGVPRTIEHRKALVKHHIRVNSLVRKDRKCGMKEHLCQGKHFTLKLIHKDTKSQCWLISQWLLGSELRSDWELPAKQLAPHCLEHLCPTELCSDGNVD